MTHGETQKVVTRVVKAVREYDSLARGIDVLVHDASNEEPVG